MLVLTASVTVLCVVETYVAKVSSVHSAQVSRIRMCTYSRCSILIWFSMSDHTTPCDSVNRHHMTSRDDAKLNKYIYGCI